MKEYQYYLFSEQSFVDFEIVQMNVDLSSKKITVEIDGGYILHSKENIEYFKKIYMDFYDWDFLSVKEYNDDSKNYKEVVSLNEGVLHNICEFVCDKDIVILKGFKKNNSGWAEWTITKSKIKIQCEPDYS